MQVTLGTDGWVGAEGATDKLKQEEGEGKAPVSNERQP
jgi:hypothetical protein